MRDGCLNGSFCYPERKKCLLDFEPIVFALNKNYAERLQDWKERANTVVDRINLVLAKTTNKKYKISQYLIYDDQNYESTGYNSSFHVDYGSVGGTTIILLVHKDGITTDDLRTISPVLKVNVGEDAFINGKTYHNIFIAMQESRNILLNKAEEIDNYEQALELTLHELGHTNGLAVPDWYLYSYFDCTNTEPILPAYDIKLVYPKDPMASAANDEHEFSPLNSKIINLNLDHNFGYMDVNKQYASSAKVLVTDTNNNPINNAEVRIFCVRKNCFYCSTSCKDNSGVVDSNIPEQVLHTDEMGVAEYDPPSGEWSFQEDENTKCLAKAIKVYYNGKSEAKYVNFLELQKDKIIHNMSIHMDHIIMS